MKTFTPHYIYSINRQTAVRLANGYLQERLHNGSRIKIIYEHGVHIYNVAKIAEAIAEHTNGLLDSETAYNIGLLHDIGRIKDETITKVPHGIEGFNYLNKIGYPELAPICITHNFIDKDIKQSDYPTYSPELFAWTKEYLSHIEYSDYDRLIQLADLFSRGKEILSIRQRLDKNKSFYHIPNLSYEDKAFALRDYFDNKYHIDVEQIVADLFKLQKQGNNKALILFFPKNYAQRLTSEKTYLEK
ncbi:MAG: HD domain-containing protein [Alphaproteobacteria bacterium]|nr:HD domain-containing protein [Alphaproteobacteria bacterium]